MLDSFVYNKHWENFEKSVSALPVNNIYIYVCIYIELKGCALSLDLEWGCVHM